MIILNKFISPNTSRYACYARYEESEDYFVFEYGYYSVEILSFADKTVFNNNIYKNKKHAIISECSAARQLIGNRIFLIRFIFLGKIYSDLHGYQEQVKITTDILMIRPYLEKVTPDKFDISLILHIYKFFYNDVPIERKKYKNYAGNMEI